MEVEVTGRWRCVKRAAVFVSIRWLLCDFDFVLDERMVEPKTEVEVGTECQ